MSHNQSRSDKSETAQYRKTGRSTSFGQQRGSAGHPGSGKGGGTATGPQASANSFSQSRSFKKGNHNANQGGQPRNSGPAVTAANCSNTSGGQRSVPNGSGQPPVHVSGTSDAPPAAGSAPRPTDAPLQKGTRSDIKTPGSNASNAAVASTDKLAPSTPGKGDGAKGFPFQFGSLSPGVMNGMQIPARTSSAPPNLDEQKRDQVRHEANRAPLPVPIPTIPKQQLPRKDSSSVDQSSSAEVHPLSKAKREIQNSSMPMASQALRPSVHPIPGMPMQIPFQQPQVQFGGPNAPPPMTLPNPMPLTIGSSPQVQQQMFVSGLQHHSMSPPGIIPQGQGMSYTAQMGPQLGPQLGSMGMNISSQYSQQQSGKFGGARKPVKITDPKTHEELRLDKRAEAYVDGSSTGLRAHASQPQSQAIPAYAPGNYYTNSYNSNIFYSTSSLTTSQVSPSSQGPRYSYPGGHPSQTLPYMTPSTFTSQLTNKPGNLVYGISDSLNLGPGVVSPVPSPAVQVTVKPAPVSAGEKAVTTSVAEKDDSHKLSKMSGQDKQSNPQRNSENSSGSSQQQIKPVCEPLAPKSVPVAIDKSAVASGSASVLASGFNTFSSAPSAISEESATVAANAETVKKEPLSRSNSMKDQYKKPAKKGLVQTQDQVAGLPSSTASSDSSASEHVLPDRDSVSMESKPKLAPITANEVNLKSAATSESATAGTASNSKSSAVSVAGSGETLQTVNYAKQDKSALQDEDPKFTTARTPGLKDSALRQGPKITEGGELSLDASSSKSLDTSKKIEKDPVVNVAAKSVEVSSLQSAQPKMGGPVISHKEADSDSCNIDSAATADAENSVPNASLNRSSNICSETVPISDQDSSTVITSSTSGASEKDEVETAESISSGQPSHTVPCSKDKSMPETGKSKSTTARGKKKRKEILQKADAAGTTSDLYMAYKGPEEKKESVSASVESSELTSNSKQSSADVATDNSVESERSGHSKAEPDDWEDAADISTPKLETSKSRGQVHGVIHHDEDGQGASTKKYSRDFLLKYADQCTTLPDNLDVKPIEGLLVSNVNNFHFNDRDSYPSPGRSVDRPSGGSHRRAGGAMDDDKWSKGQGAFASGRDLRVDLNYGGNALGFRPQGVLKNPRGQPPMQYAGGILSGPMQSPVSQGAMHRNGLDAERWQRASGFQKGLIPSPQTPLQVMHKAEKKYEVGKITDEEQAKQRQLKAILNKLTPQNFEKLFEQVKAVNIDNAVTLTGIISQIFDKALMEPTFCEMYANFCSHLAVELPDFSEDNEKITFKRLLLNKCQEEFERGEREQEEADKVEEGEIKQTKEEREEKRLKARRRMLGNIRLIGELYKKRMLTERIMHACIKKLLGVHQTPDEEDIEALCKLMSTIGEMIDHPIAKDHIDVYFERMGTLSNNMNLSSRVRFMLKDSIDLRRNKWQQRRKVEGPKKIEEVHRDAAQERHAQVSRLSRGPGINPPARRPMEFAPRVNSLPSPNAQSAGYRGLSTHGRGFGAQDRGFGGQDVRFDDRHLHENRTLPVPLSRPISDDSITLGPQGGLARGMSRGQPSILSTSLADIPPSSADSRRINSGLNGHSSIPERTSYSAREDSTRRFVPERVSHDNMNAQERNMSYASRDTQNPDRSLDSSLPGTPSTQLGAPDLTRNVVPEKGPEERLKEKSILAIREFYSAQDEQEVALCIRELNSPAFYPEMISIWVTDSFERKDLERELLAKLLISLTKSRDGMLSQPHLVKGFKAVLFTLDEYVCDAPKAAEFVGRLFAKVILENVVSLEEVGQLIYNGGQSPGMLREAGLAAEVLGTTLDIMKSEKGDSVLNEIRNSNLRLEEFKHSDPQRLGKLKLFM